jgi:isoleucyl-tRNA synthetase
MLKDRPDWVLSRQRAWGVPLTLFLRVDLPADHPDFLLRDKAVEARVLEAFAKEGADAWYQPGAKARLLGPDYDPELYEQCFDVLDVWFDSGSSHSYALEEDKEQADLYLEGTDQHRGWFQASLLHSVATTGRAPFKAVLTHGFALDAKGRKMSKSLGNTVSPDDMVKKYGTDVMRLWVAMADHRHDFRAGDEAFKGAQDAYRKMRNTLRYMLGTLGDSQYQDKGQLLKTDASTLPFFEQWLLHRMNQVNEEVMAAYQACDTARAMQAVHGFCAHDLSSLYFDVRKDTLYCDAADGQGRQTSLATVSLCLTVCLSWLAPVLVFTAEQAWVSRHGETGVHLQSFQDLRRFNNPGVSHQMAALLEQRETVTAALENMRQSGELTKAGLARVETPVPSDVDLNLLTELCLVAEVVRGDQTFAMPADHPECDRCRLVRRDVTQKGEDHLCGRCTDVVR